MCGSAHDFKKSMAFSYSVIKYFHGLASERVIDLMPS